ncbi:MAG: ABC transporter permease [Desulfobacteraceae bacterium]|nr:ABC transporter permease [Desulfobacteraceae bacterium]
MDLAAKDVRRHLGKFIATIIGVGMLINIVFIMNGIYRGIIDDGIWIIENTDTDLWVVERDRGGPFNEQSQLPRDTYKSVAATPGVAKTGPFITYTVQRGVAGRNQQFTIIGYDVFIGLGGPKRIVAGRNITAGHYEAVADQKLGVRLGERIHLGVHDYTIVGLTRQAVDTNGNPLLYLSLSDAQEVLFQRDNQAIYAQDAATIKKLQDAGYTATQAGQMLPLFSSNTNIISAVLAKLTPGADIKKVRSNIQDWLYLNVYSPEEEIQLMLSGRLKKISITLGFFRILLVIVSIVIIALIVYVITIEKIRSIATLKLIGASNWVIIRLILEQSVSITLASFGFGYGASHLLEASGQFPRHLIFTTFDTTLVFIIMLVGGVVASLLAIWVALRTPPSLALGG